ncbi:MAG: 2,3-bisphosphoglycerate-independent phosphoglycerate mutase [candidate division WOR-3 bacterium]
MFDYERLTVEPNRQKILLVILDGLGGLPKKDKTELETAWVPNLTQLARSSGLGMLVPIAPGVTPGSGAAHLAIFGYDPLRYQVGRGILEALGIGVVPRPGDLCARGNFATVDKEGVVVDRRAKVGERRMKTEECVELCARLQERIGQIDDVKVLVRAGREHRFVVIFSGEGLKEGLSDSDPGREGKKPLPVKPLVPEAERAARVVNEFIERCAEELKKRSRANWVLLRGVSLLPELPPFPERYGLRAACVAAYPMYKGLARLLGMEVLENDGTWEGEIGAVESKKDKFDFFFVHFKEFDQAGEDGDFDRKVELLEQFDERIVPRITALNFDVLCITGDHSTPAVMRSHSWHPVPLLIHSRYCRPQGFDEDFGERACRRGTLGFVSGMELMPLLLAHALRLKKFGA